MHALTDLERINELWRYEDTYDLDAYVAYMAVTRKAHLLRSYDEVLHRLAGLTGQRDDTHLFDVGAGDGHFLTLARDCGFLIHGNELAPGAIELAKSTHDIDLLTGDLREHPGAGPFDAVTMWCVLAHVPDGEALLRSVGTVMRPGGVLFFQTPRWSAMDRIAMALHRFSRGRWSRLTDRRLAVHHLVLHTADSITLLLEHSGFDVIEAIPRARYSLTTRAYLDSLRVPSAVSDRVGGFIDALVERGWIFRNVLDVYARRSAVMSEPSTAGATDSRVTA